VKIKILKESAKTPIVKVDVVNSKNSRVKYESRMSIELEDKIVYQTLTITETNKRIEGGSKAIEDLERCYPRNISKYPPEIKRIRPWNINGNASKGPNVTIFFGGRTVSAKTLEIDFRIDAIQPLDDQGKPSGSAVKNMDQYSENIFTSNSGAAMRFFNSIRKQIGEYVKNNPWYIYSFFGIETEKEMDDDFDPSRVNKRTKLYLLALRGLQRKAPGEWVITYPYEGDTNSVIFFRCPMGGINEVSTMAGGAVQGFGAPFTEEEKKLIQEMYSSAAIMGSGSGRIPAERSPEAHKRYVRIRFRRQGLQNFKPNRYFKENKRKKH
jgi:hypothetical protein